MSPCKALFPMRDRTAAPGDCTTSPVVVLLWPSGQGLAHPMGRRGYPQGPSGTTEVVRSGVLVLHYRRTIEALLLLLIVGRHFLLVHPLMVLP